MGKDYAQEFELQVSQFIRIWTDWLAQSAKTFI